VVERAANALGGLRVVSSIRTLTDCEVSRRLHQDLLLHPRLQDDGLLTEQIVACDDNIAVAGASAHDVIARPRAITSFFPRSDFFRRRRCKRGDISQRWRVTSGDNTHIWSSQ
jgi:hypothetical protein